MSQNGRCRTVVSRPEQGTAPGPEKLGERGSAGAVFKWSSLAHGSHKRSLHTEEKTDGDGASCIQCGHAQVHMSAALLFLQATRVGVETAERGRVKNM